MDPISLATSHVMTSHVPNYLSSHQEPDMGQQQQRQPLQMSSSSTVMAATRQTEVRDFLEELKAERNALDPSFIHCIRLVDQGALSLSLTACTL